MLNVGKRKGAGGAEYLLEQVAHGPEDYYLGVGERPGYWLGGGCAKLGLTEGTHVDDDALRRVLEGRDPHTEADILWRRPPDARIVRQPDGSTEWVKVERVSAYDLTFRAPKSVSLLFELCDDDNIRGEVRAAHDTAIAQVIGDYLEPEVLVARRGEGGRTQVRTSGFVAAVFEHRSSRAGDPLLHSHVLCANMLHGPDGRWTAIHAQPLYTNAKAAGYLYQAALRDQLSRRLGIEWQPVHNGVADIAGISRTAVLTFSHRRLEILDEAERRNEHGPDAMQRHALHTRQEKDFRPDYTSMRTAWAAIAELAGLTVDNVLGVLGRRRWQEPITDRAVDTVTDELMGPDGVTKTTTAFTFKDVVQGWAARLAHGANVKDTVAAAKESLAHPEVIRLRGAPQAVRSSEVLRRQDGTIVVNHDEPRYSTANMLAVEADTIARAGRLQTAGFGLADPAAVEEVCAAADGAGRTLSGEQAAVVRRVCLSGAGIEAVQGKAGTGKTFALQAARQAWDASGHTVYGAALARAAAMELQDGAGIASDTLTRRLAEWTAPQSQNLPDRAVVVVDEAAMASSRQLVDRP